MATLVFTYQAVQYQLKKSCYLNLGARARVRVCACARVACVPHRAHRSQLGLPPQICVFFGGGGRPHAGAIQIQIRAVSACTGRGTAGTTPPQKNNFSIFFVGSPAFTRALGYFVCLRRARVCKCCKDKMANMARSIVVVCVVSSYYHIFVFILLIFVLILVHACPQGEGLQGQNGKYVSLNIRHVSSYYYICVLLLLYMCAQTTLHVSAY